MGERREDARKQVPDDLRGVRMVHLATGDVKRVRSRKQDGTGWWLEEGGGLADSVIEEGSWVPLPIVLAVYKAVVSGGQSDG